MAQEILWEGQVASNSYSFVGYKYLRVYNDHLELTKNSSPDSGTDHLIKYTDITGFIPPKLGALELLITGFKGFIVNYNDSKDGNKPKKISFWPSKGGFPRGKPDNEQVIELGKVLSEMPNLKFDLAQLEKMNPAMWGGLLALFVVGWLFSGLIGIILFVSAAYFSNYIYKREDINLVLRIAIIGFAWGLTVLLILVIQILLAIWLRKI